MLDKTQPKSYGLPTDWCRVVWVTVNRLQGITARSGHISWCLREHPTRATSAGPSPAPTGEITTMPGKDGAFLRSTADEAPRARVGWLQATRIFLHPHVGCLCGFFRPRVLNQDTGLTPGRRPSSRTTTCGHRGCQLFQAPLRSLRTSPFYWGKQWGSLRRSSQIASGDTNENQHARVFSCMCVTIHFQTNQASQRDFVLTYSRC